MAWRTNRDGPGPSGTTSSSRGPGSSDPQGPRVGQTANPESVNRDGNTGRAMLNPERRTVETRRDNPIRPNRGAPPMNGPLPVGRNDDEAGPSRRSNSAQSYERVIPGDLNVNSAVQSGRQRPSHNGISLRGPAAGSGADNDQIVQNNMRQAMQDSRVDQALRQHPLRLVFDQEIDGLVDTVPRGLPDADVTASRDEPSRWMVRLRGASVRSEREPPLIAPGQTRAADSERVDWVLGQHPLRLVFDQEIDEPAYTAPSGALRALPDADAPGQARAAGPERVDWVLREHPLRLVFDQEIDGPADTVPTGLHGALQAIPDANANAPRNEPSRWMARLRGASVRSEREPPLIAPGQTRAADSERVDWVLGQHPLRLVFDQEIDEPAYTAPSGALRALPDADAPGQATAAGPERVDWVLREHPLRLVFDQEIDGPADTVPTGLHGALQAIPDANANAPRNEPSRWMARLRGASVRSEREPPLIAPGQPRAAGSERVDWVLGQHPLRLVFDQEIDGPADTVPSGHNGALRALPDADALGQARATGPERVDWVLREHPPRLVFDQEVDGPANTVPTGLDGALQAIPDADANAPRNQPNRWMVHLRGASVRSEREPLLVTPGQAQARAAGPERAPPAIIDEMQDHLRELRRQLLEPGGQSFRPAGTAACVRHNVVSTDYRVAQEFVQWFRMAGVPLMYDQDGGAYLGFIQEVPAIPRQNVPPRRINPNNQILQLLASLTAADKRCLEENHVAETLSTPPLPGQAEIPTSLYARLIKLRAILLDPSTEDFYPAGVTALREANEIDPVTDHLIGQSPLLPCLIKAEIPVARDGQNVPYLGTYCGRSWRTEGLGKEWSAKSKRAREEQQKNANDQLPYGAEQLLRLPVLQADVDPSQQTSESKKRIRALRHALLDDVNARFKPSGIAELHRLGIRDENGCISPSFLPWLKAAKVPFYNDMVNPSLYRLGVLNDSVRAQAPVVQEPLVQDPHLPPPPPPPPRVLSRDVSDKLHELVHAPEAVRVILPTNQSTQEDGVHVDDDLMHPTARDAMDAAIRRKLFQDQPRADAGQQAAAMDVDPEGGRANDEEAQAGVAIVGVLSPSPTGIVVAEEAGIGEEAGQDEIMEGQDIVAIGGEENQGNQDPPDDVDGDAQDNGNHDNPFNYGPGGLVLQQNVQLGPGLHGRPTLIVQPPPELPIATYPSTADRRHRISRRQRIMIDEGIADMVIEMYPGDGPISQTLIDKILLARQEIALHGNLKSKKICLKVKNPNSNSLADSSCDYGMGYKCKCWKQRLGMMNRTDKQRWHQYKRVVTAVTTHFIQHNLQHVNNLPQRFVWSAEHGMIFLNFLRHFGRNNLGMGPLFNCQLTENEITEFQHGTGIPAEDIIRRLEEYAHIVTQIVQANNNVLNKQAEMQFDANVEAFVEVGKYLSENIDVTDFAQIPFSLLQTWRATAWSRGFRDNIDVSVIDYIARQQLLNIAYLRQSDMTRFNLHISAERSADWIYHQLHQNNRFEPVNLPPIPDPGAG